MKNLEQYQIERQDFVDNAIFDLIQYLNPSDNMISWDIEMIGEIRDILINWYVHKRGTTSEQEFYPYLEE